MEIWDSPIFWGLAFLFVAVVFLSVMILVLSLRNQSAGDATGTIGKVAYVKRGEQWLKENNLDDDRYATILLDYCGLMGKIPVTILSVDLMSNRILLLVPFPKTNISRVMTFDLSRVTLVESTQPEVMADLMVDGDDYESPDYDWDTQIPLNEFDWDYAVSLITSVEVYLPKELKDRLFPEK